MADLVASGITAQRRRPSGVRTPRTRPSKRLGWTEAVADLAPARRRDRRPARRAAEADGVDAHRARRHGRLVARPRGHHAHARRRLTVLDSTEPGQVRAALADRLAEHRRRRSRRSRARPSRPTARSASTSRRSATRASTRADAHHRRHRPRLAARRVGARRRLPRLQRRPQRRRPLLGADRLRPRAVAASPASTSRELLDEAEAIALALAIDSRRRTPASCSAPRSPATAPAAATSSASSPTAPTSSASATGPSSSSPSRPARTARASCPSSSTSTPPSSSASLPDLQVVRLVDDARRPDEVARRARSRSSGTPRRAAPGLGVRHRRRRPPARHQPVRPARRRVGEDRHARPARRPSRARAARVRRPTASRCAARPTSSARRATSSSAIDVLLEELARRRLHLGPGLRRPRRPPRSSPSSATCSPRAPAARSRSAGARASCTRPASSTRAAPRSACSCRSPQTPARTSRSPIARSPSASSSQAQAAGDASVLAEHGRPVLTPHPDGRRREHRGAVRRASADPEEDRMAPVEISPEHNPLRSPKDYRLNRIAGPSEPHHLRRDRRPVAQEADAGGLRPRQPRPAAARASRSSASPGATGTTRTSRRSCTTRSSSTRAPPFDEDVWKQLAQGIRFVQGDFDDDAAFDRLQGRRSRSSTATAARWATTRSTCRSRRSRSRWSPSSCAAPASPSRRTASGAASSSRSRSVTT